MSEFKIRKMELNYSSSSKVEMAACAFTWHVNANNTKMMMIQKRAYLMIKYAIFICFLLRADVLKIV